MPSIALTASCCIGISLLVLTLVECITPAHDELVPQHRGDRIRDLSDQSTNSSRAESVTSLLTRHQHQLRARAGSQENSSQTTQARAKLPALQRLIAQSQATKVDTKSNSGSGGGGGGDENFQVSSALTTQRGEASKHSSSLSARQAKCGAQGQVDSSEGFFETLKAGTKNLATGGGGGLASSIERRAGSLLGLGSNVLAALIPLASLLPGFGHAAKSGTKSGSFNPDHGHAGAHQGAAQPTASTSIRTGSLWSAQNLMALVGPKAGGLQSRVEHVMGWLERSIEHLPNFPRLHPQECVKRCICEAHADPSKYGALGLTLRLLFPATKMSITEGQDNMEYKVINKYRHAASYGMARRAFDSTGDGNNLTSGAGGSSWTGSGEQNNLAAATVACKEKYEDCLVSLLDVAQNLVDFFLNKS